MIGTIPLFPRRVCTVEQFLTRVADFWEGQAPLVSTGGIQRLWASLKISADYLVHQYCTDEDWDRYANLTGDPGWAWKNIKKYVKKVSTPFQRFSITIFISSRTLIGFSSTRNLYLQTTGTIQPANLSRLCMVSTGRSPSVFQGSTCRLTHASWRQPGSYPNFPSLRTQAEVTTAFSGSVFSKRPLEKGSGAARRLAISPMRIAAQISQC